MFMPVTVAAERYQIFWQFLAIGTGIGDVVQ